MSSWKRSILVGAVPVGLLAGCSFYADVDQADPEPAPTGVVVQSDAAEVAQTLAGPDDVEEFVREYGDCAIDGHPGAGLAIAFDEDSGFVGGMRMVAESDERIDQLDEARHICNVEMDFIDSVNAYAEASPEAAALIPVGLEPAEGQQLVFGERSFFD